MTVPTQRIVTVAADSAAAPSPLEWPEKDPHELLDYAIDWTPRLDADTIETSTWIKPASGVVVSSEGKTTTETSLWLAGGEVGKTYRLTNRVVTDAGRTMDQTVTITVASK